MSTAQEEIHKYGLQPILYIAIPAVLLVLTNFSLALRAYVRCFMIRAWGVDDTFLVIANVSDSATLGDSTVEDGG